MNKLKWIIPTLLVGICAFPSCFIVDDDGGWFNCVDGSGPLETRELVLPDGVTGVELRMSATVFISQGAEQKITVEGKPNIIDELELDVNNGVWAIETDRCVRDVGNMKVFITLPAVTWLKISGSGDIISESFLTTDDIVLAINGSGGMDLGLNSDDIDAKISGSGSITLEGDADQIDLSISGSGDYAGFNMEANSMDVNISGSGDADVRVLNELDVRISGSGDVRFKGNPVLNVSISGSGRVIDAN